MKKEIRFESEYILHRLTQKHLKELFDLEFVASEIQLNGLRLDTLAFDKKCNAFVIIEYKNKFSANVLNQAQGYHDLILNNKDFFLKRLDNVENVDFKKTRIMIIGPKFSTEQIKNAKSYFELWKTSLCDNCTVSYENLKSGEIKSISINPNDLKITEEMLLENKSEKIKSLYFKLKNSVLEEFDDIEIRYLVDAFSLKVNGSIICIVKFLKSSFNIDFFADSLENAEGLRDISQISTGGKANYQMKYSSDYDLNCFMDLFRQTYNQRNTEND